MRHFGFRALIKRVRFLGKIVCKTALHIGSNQSVEVDQVDNPVLLDIHKKPFIPGSSLKGVLRITLESLLRGYSPEHANLLACDVLDDSKLCIVREEKERWQEQGILEENVCQKSCAVCRLFGSPWLASKVKIPDLSLAQDHALLESRTGVAIDRDKETSAGKQLYDFEAVAPGTKFHFELLVDNPEDHELGMLTMSLQQFNQGYVCLGGITSRGLGRIQIIIEKIHTITAKDICIGKHGETIPKPISDLPEHYQILRQAIQRLRKERPQEKANSSTLAPLLREMGWDKDRIYKNGLGQDFSMFLTRAIKEHVIVGDKTTVLLPEEIPANSYTPENLSIENKLEEYTQSLRIWLENKSWIH